MAVLTLGRGALSSSRRVRTTSFTVAVLGAAALAGATSAAAPTGLAGVDRVWTGLLVATVAYLAATARRWTWFLPAGVGAALAGDGLALVAAMAAIGLGFWSVLGDTRSRARGAVVGGLGCLALLRTEPVAFHGSTALLAAAAIVPVAVSGYRLAGRRAQRRIRRAAAAAGALAGLVTVGAVIGVVSVGGDVTQASRLIDEGLVAARDADDDLAGERLGEAARHLTSAEATLSSWFVTPARLLPIVGPNLDAVESLADETGRVATVTSLAASDADVDSLRFIGGRLDPEAVADMQRPLQDTLAALETLERTIDDARSPWLIASIADRREQVRNQVDEALPDARMALAGVRAAPTMLGADGTRRYLVLFVTPVEARGRTGFPGNFAELVVDDGKLSMPRFGRISELEQGGVPGARRQVSQAPPDYLERYSRFDVAATWRNLTMSPDFPSVALAARELYPQSGGSEIDGVLAVDPVGLAALLRYTGSVEIDGYDEPLTEDNAAKFLLLDQYVEFTDVSQRIDVLEEVSRTTFERLTAADLPGPRAVSDQLDPVVDAGHIQFVTFDTSEFLILNDLRLDGALGEVEGDALAVTSSNAGGSKIDLFLRRQLDYDVTWDPASGAVSGTVTATLTNMAPADGLPDYVLGNALELPPGTNRSYVSLYTPHDVREARIDGRPAAVESAQELGRNVYSAFVTIPPGGTVTIELDVTGTVEGDRYRLDVAPQPMVWPEEGRVSVTVAGEGGEPAAVDGDRRRLEVDGRTATWSGSLDRRATLTVTAPH